MLLMQDKSQHTEQFIQFLQVFFLIILSSINPLTPPLYLNRKKPL